MRIFGFDIARAQTEVERAKAQTLSAVNSTGGWFGMIRESFAGAWQRNIEVDAPREVLAFSAVFACVVRHRERYRQDANQARRRGRQRHRRRGQDRLAISATSRQAQSLPDAHQVHRVMGGLQAALWQHLRAQAARRAQHGQRHFICWTRSASRRWSQTMGACITSSPRITWRRSRRRSPCRLPKSSTTAWSACGTRSSAFRRSTPAVCPRPWATASRATAPSFSTT